MHVYKNNISILAEVKTISYGNSGKDQHYDKNLGIR